jgi:hypothetical protein
MATAKRVCAYGSWPSPITAASLVEGSRARLAQAASQSKPKL